MEDDGDQDQAQALAAAGPPGPLPRHRPGPLPPLRLGVPFLAPDLVRTNDDPRVLALTHLAVLGWITMIMFVQ